MTDYKSFSNDQWRARLSEAQYRITRERGTERAFTGRYWDHDEQGGYSCVCCGTPLFRSTQKFASSCGWPSFFEELAGANIERRLDLSHGMRRIEIVCGTCDAHLGHVFPDGPPPTGERYCVNSEALTFLPDVVDSEE